MSESSWNGRRHHHRVETRPTSAASARKLVGAIWQLDSGVAGEREGEVGWDATRRSSDHHRRSASMELSKLSRRRRKALDGDGERSWHNGRVHGHWFSDVRSNAGTMEGLASPCRDLGDRMAQLQELYNSMTASKELVRVLANNVLAPGALNPTAASLLAALRSELDVARARARQLVREQSHCGGGDEAEQQQLRERMAEEVRAWKSRHREKAAAAARLVGSELEAERRSRLRAERVGRKLGEALAEAEASLREARRELERERQARERLQKACDELAATSGVGGEEELMRREAEREELEREREMLRLADELREERVRMKLAEARVQFEEKNAVVDRLRQELEAFLGRRENGKENGQGDSAGNDHPTQPELLLASEPAAAMHTNGEDGAESDDGHDGCGEVGNDSDDGSDIELNVDGGSRDYSWSYSTASKETPGAKNERSSRHGSFSDRGTESGAFDRSAQGLDPHWNVEGCRDDDDYDDEYEDRTACTKDMDDEDAERYEAIKNLREQMLAGHGFVFLSQPAGGQDAADDDKDHRHRHSGFVSQVEEGLW